MSAMLEHPDIIRANIKHYEKLLKVSSPDYSHEDVRNLLDETKARLRIALLEIPQQRQ